eukprot:TRINITY_DN34808_c0_g1_i1.p1 TRINITY_DN34808_c0_g1~~TRINITY_DN34808_c0_g1_i1.p1  ORF type:complete len:263 (-),score=26.51 TRINITY_DN34808_c0_g1_i1:163-951(-)
MSWFRKTCWSTLGLVGGRNLGDLAFDEDTLCYYDEQKHPGVVGHIAMTIDDAPCLGDASESLVDDLLELLARYNFKATFMICSDFVPAHEESMRKIVAAGHELANHMPADRSYSGDSYEDVIASLDRTSEVIQQFQSGPVRWFRAPHGRYSKNMQRCVREREMINVMVDCYANDPHIEDPVYISNFMLENVKSGSVALIHTPQKSFRRWNLPAIELFLEGLREKGLRAVTVGQLTELAQPNGASVCCIGGGDFALLDSECEQ